MTTYDELYTLFITNCQSEGLMLPRTESQKYDVIRNAVMLWNNRFRDSLFCDDETELVNRIMTDDEKLIIAHYIRLTLLKNVRTYKNSIFTTFTKEIGVTNITAQLNSLKDEIADEENTIGMLIFYMTDESIM